MFSNCYLCHGRLALRVMEVTSSQLRPGGIRVRLLPSAVGGQAHQQYANTFLINETTGIDAGSLGFNGTPEEQSRVREILLTHSHADHIASLPILLINTFSPDRKCARVWATTETETTLRKHVFNDEVWPDLDRIGSPGAPFVRWGRLTPEQPVVIDGLRYTPIPVNHTVPTVAFLVESRDVSLVIGGDTAPTNLLWEKACGLANLKGVFLETSFPNRESELAVAAKHLRPATFALEVAKMPQGTPFYAVHFKPDMAREIEDELQALGLPHLEIVQPGREYCF